ncbi:MAG: DNA repair protein RadC [Bacteroidales bacterium]|nr:DNA repair protein RadC [Bacteroidales bacterium]
MSYTIKQWQAEERPREKMLAQGCGSLTAAELIAVLIRSGSATRTAVDTARDILALADNNLTTLSRMSPEALQGVPGVGEAKALAVIAAAELGRRIAIESGTVLPAITSAAQAAAIAVPTLKGLPHEECWVLFLTSGNRLIGKERISQGDDCSTRIDAKQVARRAVEKAAGGIILIHNHPSGNPKPGESDIRITETIRKALLYFDIKLVDHLIVAGNNYFSFFDKNR